MNIDLYKSIVNGAVSNSRNLTDATKQEVNAVTSALSPYIAVEVKDTQILPDQTNWDENGLTIEKLVVDLNSTLAPLKILRLYDGTFLIVFADKPARHYTKDFGLISELPFSFDSPVTGSNAQGYGGVVDATSCDYNIMVNSSLQDCSLVCLAISTKHVVQCVKYSNKVWSFVRTIGTIGTLGNGSSNLLSTPIAVAVSWELSSPSASSRRFRVIISNSGTAANGQDSFLKELFMDSAGASLLDPKEISYPQQYTTSVTSAGSLLVNETKNVVRIALTQDSILSILTITGDIGEITLSRNLLTTPNTTNFVKVGTAPIVALPHNDTLTEVNIIKRLVDGTYIVGDDKGHIGIFSSSLAVLLGSVGKPPSNTTVPTSYSEEWGSIKDINIDEANLVILTDKGVFRCNILALTNNVVTFTTSNDIPINTRIEKLVGFNKGLLEISLDGVVYKDANFFELTKVPAFATIYIRITRNLEDSKYRPEALQGGFVILSI